MSLDYMNPWGHPHYTGERIYREVCQTCGHYIREVHACDPTQCFARFQGRDWCQTPYPHPDDDHHDAITTGPWVRWCDDPANCHRPDCDLSED
jgi:hypothetical protein